MEQSKQKQIKEMATILYKRIATLERFGLTAMDLCEKISEELLKYYQPKIPENAVVLTREEFDKKLEPFRLEIISLSQELIETSQKLMKAHKETAEKFAERVSKAFIGLNCIDIDEWNWCQRKIDEICKEITEGKDGNYKQDCRLDSKRKL